MSFLKYLSPMRAVRDLRGFLKLRHRYEPVFMLAAFAVTMLVVLALNKDSYFERAYKREIVYVQSWPADRSIDQILAKQAVDEAVRLKRIGELKAKADQRQREWQKIDNGLQEWGF